MKLKYPYIWAERKVTFQDGILFVPDQLEVYDPFTIAFDNQNPIHAEYCSGNGAWILSKALEFPHINWIAIEKKFDRVAKIWSKMVRNGVKNLLIICGEGMLTTKLYFQDQSLSHVYVNFPDPWPKKRHWKHRIVQQPFLEEMARVLKTEGKVTFVTDDPDYSDVMNQELEQSKHFVFIAQTNELPGYGSSYFEELWRSKGKQIFYHQWEVNGKNLINALY